MIRILIAEDQGMVRSALTSLLNMEEDMTVVAEAADGEVAYKLYTQHQPDVAVVDIEMPIVSGLDLTQRICSHNTTCKVLVVTTFARPGYLQRALKAGASGYLLKDAAWEDLVTAIRTIHRGGRVVSPELMMAALEAENPLTTREVEVLFAARAGLTTRDIAKRLCLSEGTVRNYLSETISKLGVQTRIEAVRFAEEKGWLQ